MNELIDHDGSMGTDDDSIDSEATSIFDIILLEIDTNSYICLKLSTKSQYGKKIIEELYLKLLYLRMHQEKVRHEMNESVVMTLCKAVDGLLSFDEFQIYETFSLDMESNLSICSSKVFCLYYSYIIGLRPTCSFSVF
jgi:hypothetical protein